MPHSTVEELFNNKWISLKIVKKPEVGVNGYVFSHETRCKGKIVAILPYRKTKDGIEYLLKSEMTPCWGFDQVLSAITGGWEGGDIQDDAVREMKEETGYEITKQELIYLGRSYASKSSDTEYVLFSVDLTGKEAGEAIGDGSRVESESKAVWLKDIKMIEDPQVSVMFARLGFVDSNASDGYHTFNEPYDHRIALYISLANTLYYLIKNCQHRAFSHIKEVWKSYLHHDMTKLDGWFIAGINFSDGKSITYHIPVERWQELRCKELSKAPEWDGHTPADVLERIKKYLY